MCDQMTAILYKRHIYTRITVYSLKVQILLSFNSYLCNYAIYSEEQNTDIGESTMNEHVSNAETTALPEVRTNEDGSTLSTYSDT